MLPIKSKGDEALETLLNQATNPINPSENWDVINGFCDEVRKEIEGPQIAVKLLAHKIQSPQEKEALYAIAVLDACVKNCGERFHQEIGKFRFLNELIKVISPKYLGATSPEAVKRRLVELLYCWHKGLTREGKITEAYTMLRRQGIIKQDPTYADHMVFKPGTPPPKPPSIFDSGKESERLSRLLKSRNPDDLREANRLIKSIVQEDNDRVEKLSKRLTELETVRNNKRLLEEMLNHYQPGQTQLADVEIMKELVDTMEKSRPNLFKMARDTDDKDQETINEIIGVSDAVTEAIRRYREVVDESILNLGETAPAASGITEGPKPAGMDLIGFGFGGLNGVGDLLSQDLAALGIANTTSPVTKQQKPSDEDGATATVPRSMTSQLHTQDADLLNIDLLSTAVPLPLLSLHEGSPNHDRALMPTTAPTQAAPVISGAVIGKPATPSGKSVATSTTVPAHNSKVLEELDLLSRQLLITKGSAKQALSLGQTAAASQPLTSRSSGESSPTPPDGSTAVADPTPTATSSSAGHQHPHIDLSDISVSLTTIRPCTQHRPMVIHADSNQVKVMLHFTEDRPRPSVLVLVAVITSENTLPVSQIAFKVAVPKMLRVRQLAPSADQLPPYSPFLPPSAVSQILLIDNPNKEPVKLKFQFSYQLDEEAVLESGQSPLLPVQ